METRLDLAARVSGIIAHDLNNLLIPLVGYPDLIRSLLPAESPIAGYVEKIQRSALLIHEANQRLLALSTGPRLAIEELAPARLVEEELSRIVLPAGVDLVRRLGQGRPIRVSRARIALALAHLVANAIEAMPDGGSLLVETGEVGSPTGTAGVLPVGPGEYATIAVSDTGRGIPAGEMERLFEPFYSTKARKGGLRSGLGLATVHAAIREHLGGIAVESQMGRGSTFRLYLPIPPAPLAQPAFRSG